LSSSFSASIRAMISFTIGRSLLVDGRAEELRRVEIADRIVGIHVCGIIRYGGRRFQPAVRRSCLKAV